MTASMAIRLLSPPAARRGLPLLLLGLLFACAPSASSARPLHPANPNPVCARRHYPPPASLCLSLEGDPLPGLPFTLTIDAFYYAWSEEPPYTLTLILPAVLEVLNPDTSRPYTRHASIPVSFLDPAVYSAYTDYPGRGAFTATGTLIAVDLGRIGQQSLRDPNEPRQRRGERVRLTLRLSEAGEWQVRGILHQGERVVRLEQDLLGWSALSQAYWTDYETARMRMVLEVEGSQCRSTLHCTLRFPYDPYRYLIGAPAEAPGRPLRERPTTFCDAFDRPGACADYGLLEDHDVPIAPEGLPVPTPSFPPPAAPARWLDLWGKIHFLDPRTGSLPPARGVRVERCGTSPDPRPALAGGPSSPPPDPRAGPLPPRPSPAAAPDSASPTPRRMAPIPSASPPPSPSASSCVFTPRTTRA